MILLKNALSSILVVLGACDRAPEGSPSAPGQADLTSPSAVTAGPLVSADSSTMAPASALPPSSTDRKGSPHSAVKPTVGARDGVKTVYVCPMNPEVVSDTPGLWPKCNMKLDPKPQQTEVRQGEGRQDSPTGL